MRSGVTPSVLLVTSHHGSRADRLERSAGRNDALLDRHRTKFGSDRTGACSSRTISALFITLVVEDAGKQHLVHPPLFVFFTVRDKVIRSRVLVGSFERVFLLDFGSSGDVEAGKRDDPESGAILRCFEVVETETLEDKPPPPPVPRSQTTTAQLQ